MNYSRAFSYVFEDKNWLSKILIAGLISLIPIIGQFYLFGWMIEIIRRVKAGRTDILPTTHFSYFLTLGLKYFVVALIYSIPALILSGILSLVHSSVEYSDSGFVTVIFTGVGCIGGLLTLVVNIAVALLGTYGAIKLAETDQIKACLDFSDAYNTIKANLTAFIIVELLAIVAGLIESAGIILCFVGIILTAPYGTAVIANLIGQLWDNLKPYEKTDKGPRGSVIEKSEDIIEEAPFTMVQDLENEMPSEPAGEEVQEAVIEPEETPVESEETEIPSDPTEVPSEDILENIVDENEENREEPAADPEADAEEKPESDIPSFE